MKQLLPLALRGKAWCLHRVLSYDICHNETFYSLTTRCQYNRYYFSTLEVRNFFTLEAEYIVSNPIVYGGVGYTFTKWERCKGRSTILRL